MIHHPSMADIIPRLFTACAEHRPAILTQSEAEALAIAVTPGAVLVVAGESFPVSDIPLEILPNSITEWPTR